MNVLFGSQVIQRPGVYSKVNPNGTAILTTGAPFVVGFVGQSNGTAPNVANIWSSPLQAGSLRGGDLQNAVNFAWNPSTVVHGATEVVTIRVGEPTQASAYLQSSNGSNAVYVQSNDYGSWNNGIEVAVNSGTVAGTEQVTLQYIPDNFTVTSPNLGGAFTLEYTGNGTSATAILTTGLSAPDTPTVSGLAGGSIPSGTTVYIQLTATNASGESLPSTIANYATTVNSGEITITDTLEPGATGYNVYAGVASGSLFFAGNTTTFPYTLTSVPTVGAVPPTVNSTGLDLVTTVSGQTDGSQSLDLNLSLAAYSTVQGLVNAISGNVGYTAATVGIGAMPTSYLDPLSSTSILNATASVNAKQGSVIYWVNANNQYVTFSGVTGNTSALALTNGFIHLAGGSNGPVPSTSDWQNALSVMNTQNVDVVVPLTSNTAIQQLFDANNRILAETGRGFRTGIYGGALGQTYSQTLQISQTLNSDRAVIAAPGFYQNDYTGTYTEFPPYMLAAIYAGIAVGGNVSTPLTYKQLNILALEQTYDYTEVNSLIGTGIALAVPIRSGGFRIEQGVTSSISGTTLYNVEYSVIRSVDYVRAALAKAFEAYVGTASEGSVTTAEFVTTATNVLNNMVSNGIISSFDSVSGITQSSSNPTVYQVPTNVYVRDPINNVLVTVNLAS